MSDRKKYPRAEALAVADEMAGRLTPVCSRLAVVGSLRRLKAQAGDVELLFAPRYAERPDGLFSQRIVDLADECCDDLLATGVLAKRMGENGRTAWGVLNKLAIHVASGIPIDLFSSSEEKWWVSLVVRTGSKETNLKLTAGARLRNGSLLAYGAGVMDLETGKTIRAISERHVFALCGVDYLEPEER